MWLPWPSSFTVWLLLKGDRNFGWILLLLIHLYEAAEGLQYLLSGYRIKEPDLVVINLGKVGSTLRGGCQAQSFGPNEPYREFAAALSRSLVQLRE